MRRIGITSSWPRASAALRVAAFALLFEATACGGDDITAEPIEVIAHRPSAMTILFSDPPGRALDSAVVTIEQVYLEGRTPKDPEALPTRVDLLPSPVTIDLEAAHGELTALVEDAPVPKGRYAHLRIVLGGALVGLTDAQGHATYATHGYDQVPADTPLIGRLMVPSAAAGDLDVVLPEEPLELDGDTLTVVVDFDLGETPLRPSGNGDLILHPTSFGTSMDAAASLEVAVALDPSVKGPAIPRGETEPKDRTLDGFAAAIWYGASDQIRRATLADDDGDGVYTARFPTLVPSSGPFVLSLEPAEDVWIWSDPVVPMDVDLAPGEAQRLDVTIVDYGWGGAEL